MSDAMLRTESAFSAPRPTGKSVAEVADLMLFRARERLQRGEWGGAVVLLEICIEMIEGVDEEGVELLADAG